MINTTMNAVNDYSDLGVQQRIKDQLLTQTLRVSFTKADGERRDMHCTLRPDVIPAPTSSANPRASSPRATSIAVFDTRANAWRSFCWARVIEVSTDVQTDADK